MDPQPRGPDWMQITPKAGALFHATSHPGYFTPSRSQIPYVNLSIHTARAIA